MGRKGFMNKLMFGNKSVSQKSKHSKLNKKRKREVAKPCTPYLSEIDADWLEDLMVDRPRTFTYDVVDDNELPHDDLDDEVLLCSLRGDIVGMQYYKGTVNSQEMVSLCREPYNKYDRNAIKVNNVDGDQVGHIKRELAKPLSQIMDSGLGRVEGIVPFGANNLYRISIDLTIWGKPENKAKVMRILQTHSVGVKESLGSSPVSGSLAIPAGLDYSHVVTSRVLLSPNEVKNELDRLFETLDEGDKTSMMEKAPAVVTNLYPHQKQALNWMVLRENGNLLPPFWEERKNGTYYNSLTVFTTNTRPSSVRGGILADDMGLGKTLEMIALILTNFVDKKPLAVPVPGRSRKSVPRRIKKSVKKQQNGHVEVSNYNSLSNGIKKVENISLEEKMAALEYSLAADIPEKDLDIKKKLINIPKLVLPQPSTSCVKSDTKILPPLPRLKMEKSDSVWCGKKESDEVIVLSESSADEEDVHITDKVILDKKDPDFSPVTSLPVLSGSSARPKRAVKKPLRYNFSESDGVCSDEEHSPRKKARMLGPSSEPVQSKKCGKGKHKGKGKGKGKSVASKPIQMKPVSSVLVDEDLEDLPDISCPEKQCHKETSYESSDDDLPNLEDPMLVDAANLSNCDTMTGRSNCDGPRTTLIICPLSVMNNWLTQLNEHIHPNVHLEIYTYYGPSRKHDSKLLAQQDIVLTTYSTVASDFKMYQNKSPIKKVHWLRIVLDEGHMIRNPNALQTKAIMELKAERRWVLTGTPIQNSMKDLWSLVNFLNISPLTDRQWWHRTIERPLTHGDKSAIKRVQHLMGNIAMRRTKTQMVNGKPMISLPDKTIAVEHITLSKEERDIYTAMQNEGRLIINRYFQQGTLLHHYGQVLAILMRLRQLCCHPLLVAKAVAAVADSISTMDGSVGSGVDEDRKQRLIASLLEVLNSGSDEECSVCLESLRLPVITPCAHVYCRPCIQAVINNEKPNSKCPLCRAAISESELLQVPPEGMSENIEQPQVTPTNWQSSAKVDALMKSLVKLREEDASIKSIVVSQFTSLLTLLEIPLKLNGFKFVHLDGGMSARARVESVDQFMDMSPGTPTVFLLSLKAGGVGINLTAASRVFLMDPAWNPASEEQCFDRCHRLGQTRNVIITKFLVKDSVEERMMELQEKKRQLMQGAFGKKQTAEQRRAQRITDIKTLINL